MDIDQCMTYHKKQPWIKNFDSILIKPTVYTSENYAFLGKKVNFPAMAHLKGDWYEPSKFFWLDHCKKDHLTHSNSFSLEAHRERFAMDLPSSKYVYAILKTDGTFSIASSLSFEDEEEWINLDMKFIQKQFKRSIKEFHLTDMQIDKTLQEEDNNTQKILGNAGIIAVFIGAFIISIYFTYIMGQIATARHDRAIIVSKALQ